jgi:hypothetical protein
MNGHSATTNGTNGAHEEVDLSELEYDPLQLEMMKEELIVVDYDDNPIGKDSKKTCKQRLLFNAYLEAQRAHFDPICACLVW